MKKEDIAMEDPFKDREFVVRAEKAQPLMVLEYLNSWGNEFLFIFLLIALAFLLVFVNQLMYAMPDSVQTIIGVEVPTYLATQLPVFVLIIAAIALAVYYNMRRRYVENMMYFFYQRTAENELRESGSKRAPGKARASPKKPASGD